MTDSSYSKKTSLLSVEVPRDILGSCLQVLRPDTVPASVLYVHK